jgi:hypothetical protein
VVALVGWSLHRMSYFSAKHTGQIKDFGFNSGQIGSNSSLFFLLDLLKQDEQVGFLHFEQIPPERVPN